jgi:electron transfer flavoprotein beta subunit
MNRILVGIKRVIDYNVKVRVKPDGTGVITEGVKLSINPFDEIAIEEAVRQREKGACQEVVVATVGPTDAEAQLRTALAMGADRAILVHTASAPEPLAVARAFLKLTEDERPSLVMFGKQAVDQNNGQTAQMLAALWGRPQATFASTIEIGRDTARVTREVDAGLEVLDVDLPAVVSTDLRLNEPRWVKLAEIMKARKKPLATVTLEAMGVGATTRMKVVKYEPPVQRQKGVIVKDTGELVAALRSKGVI